MAFKVICARDALVFDPIDVTVLIVAYPFVAVFAVVLWFAILHLFYSSNDLEIYCSPSTIFHFDTDLIV